MKSIFRLVNFAIGLVGLLLVGGCNKVSVTEDVLHDSSPNFIVMVGDDMGIETLSAYGIGSDPAATPNLDQLAAKGMLFENFWTQPNCSPTRATLLTGRYGFRTNVLLPVLPREDLFPAKRPPLDDSARPELQYHPMTGFITPGTPPGGLPPFVVPGSPATGGLGADEKALPAVLKQLPSKYATAAVGKWHLADSANGWLDHPNRAGFEYYSGVLLGEGDSYQHWLHVENGEASGEAGYIDSRTVDDGIHWLRQRRSKQQPWLLWVGFVNPHVPIHLPPADLLHSKEALELRESELTPDNARPFVMAMIEAMDAEIGRLLEAIPESQRDNTWVIFLGDNGSASWAQPAEPLDAARVKMTVYEGGVRSPLIVAGPGVADPGKTQALVNSVDIFNTIIELAGGSTSSELDDGRPIDSVSFAGVLKGENAPRNWIFADTTWGGTYKYAIRDQQYKLLINKRGKALFDLANDPWEKSNLLDSELDAPATAAYSRLMQQLGDLLPAEPPPITRPFPDNL